MKDIFLIALSLCLLMISYCHANGNYQIHQDGTVTYIGSGFSDYNNEDVFNFDRLYFSKYDYKDNRREHEAETTYERDRRHRNNSERSEVRKRSY